MRTQPSHISWTPSSQQSDPIHPILNAQVLKLEKTNVVQEIRQYRLITPLFGGGVTPAELDLITPIRGTEVRAHLRFWWRACRGGQFQDLAALKNAEAALWGKASKKGDTPLSFDHTVQIVVETHLEQKQDVFPFIVDQTRKRLVINKSSGVPDYAAFPLQPTREEARQGPTFKPKTVTRGLTFTLTITYPGTHQKDIQAALWAWETFGGVGARTRRGFGAIQRINATEKDLPPKDIRQVSAWLTQQLQEWIPSTAFPDNVPHLTPTLSFALLGSGTPENVWKQLIDKLRDFRQHPVGRSGSFGKSKWPEAHAIRHMVTGRPTRELVLFPRAAFGLPIVFHFNGKSQGDPAGDVILQGVSEEHERLPSPLILRPLACQNGQAVGLALLLEGCDYPLDKLVLHSEGQASIHQRPVSGRLTQHNAEHLTRAIPEINKQQDLLHAFLLYIKGTTL